MRISVAIDILSLATLVRPCTARERRCWTGCPNVAGAGCAGATPRGSDQAADPCGGRLRLTLYGFPPLLDRMFRSAGAGQDVLTSRAQDAQERRRARAAAGN